MKVIFNGEVLDTQQAQVFESGWLDGEGIFETIKTVKNMPYALARHLDRGLRSAGQLSIAMPLQEEIMKGVADLLLAQRQENGMLRICFDNKSNWLAVHMPYVDSTVALDLRVDPTVVVGQMHKTFPYKHRIEILENARLSGFDDAITVNSQGNLSEGSVTNLIVHLDGRWITPPVSDGLLPGIMRELLIENELVGIESIPLRRIEDITSAFLISSVRLAQPISSIDSRALHLSHAFGQEIHALAHKYSVG